MILSEDFLYILGAFLIHLHPKTAVRISPPMDIILISDDVGERTIIKQIAPNAHVSIIRISFSNGKS